MSDGTTCHRIKRIYVTITFIVNNMQKELLNIIEQFKCFPYYAAERRIDLFFCYHINEILKNANIGEAKLIAPEFPLKQIDKNISFRADMLCLLETPFTPLIVEIKTDTYSFNPNQLENYKQHIKPWKEIIESLATATRECKHTHNKFKYFKLIDRLTNNDLIDNSLENKKITGEIKQLETATSQKDKSTRSSKINKLALQMKSKLDVKPTLVYICPKSIADQIKHKQSNDMKIIAFSDLAINRHESESYNQFVSFLHSIT